MTFTTSTYPYNYTQIKKHNMNYQHPRSTPRALFYPDFSHYRLVSVFFFEFNISTKVSIRLQLRL